MYPFWTVRDGETVTLCFANKADAYNALENYLIPTRSPSGACDKSQELRDSSGKRRARTAREMVEMVYRVYGLVAREAEVSEQDALDQDAERGRSMLRRRLWGG